MNDLKYYDNFPARIVFIANAVAILLYGFGLIVCFRLHWITGLLYLFYIVFLEFRLISRHCINCYYYGKICGFGKSWLSTKLFQKGDVSRFCAGEMSWKDMIPDMLVVLIPLVVGVILLVQELDWLVLTGIVIMILLTTFGNSYVRGSLTCKYCRQRALGCPAEKLFEKKK